MLLCSASFTVVGQDDILEYAASNGITYHKGDKVTLGTGSASEGDFQFLRTGGMEIATNEFENKKDLIIKSIGTFQKEDARMVYFTLEGKDKSICKLLIEEAISNCEVLPCPLKMQMKIISAKDPRDRLEKLQELYDTGAIEEEEYETMRQEILNDI
jgi:hypothetical protein